MNANTISNEILTKATEIMEFNKENKYLTLNLVIDEFMEMHKSLSTEGNRIFVNACIMGNQGPTNSIKGEYICSSVEESIKCVDELYRFYEDYYGNSIEITPVFKSVNEYVYRYNGFPERFLHINVSVKISLTSADIAKKFITTINGSLPDSDLECIENNRFILWSNREAKAVVTYKEVKPNGDSFDLIVNNAYTPAGDKDYIISVSNEMFIKTLKDNIEHLYEIWRKCKMGNNVKHFDSSMVLKNGALQSTREFNMYKYPNGLYGFDIIHCGDWKDEGNLLDLDQLIEVCEYWGIDEIIIQSLKDGTLDWQ